MIYDIIIIGGGPAGMTAGIYCARQKMSILLLTKEFGGQMAKKAVEIENYPGLPKITGLDLIEKFKQHLESLGINPLISEVVRIEKKKDSFLVYTKDGKEHKSRTVLVASGAEPRILSVLGEKEFIGRGVSYCPMCDGPLFRDKKVAVVGGGNAGFETAAWLTNYVKEVIILEFAPKITADKINQEMAKKKGKIKTMTGVEVKEIKGDTFVNSLVYKKGGKERVLKVDGVFIEVGYDPASSLVEGMVELNDRGEIKVNPDTGETKTKGLYAAGDVDRGKCKQIIVACGEGAVAANAIYKYLWSLK